MPTHSRQQLASRRARRRVIDRRRRRRRAVMSLVVPVSLALLVVAVLLVGSGGDRRETPVATPAPALGPGGTPPDLVIARAGQIQLKLPVDRARVTAIAYHALDDPRAMELEPTGPIEHHDSPRGDRPGPARAGLDVGAPAGTMVYSPVDGIVVAVGRYVIRGRAVGLQIGIEPLAATGVLVMVTHVEPHPGTPVPRVGEAVQAGRTPLGQVPDLSAIVDQEISRFTADAGNHVAISVTRTAGP
jgi:hypothetical protein